MRLCAMVDPAEEGMVHRTGTTKRKPSSPKRGCSDQPLKSEIMKHDHKEDHGAKI